jgi:predicted transcriptional regulator
MKSPQKASSKRMRMNECNTLPVADDGHIVGLLTMENISELVMLRAASSGLLRKTALG